MSLFKKPFMDNSVQSPISSKSRVFGLSDKQIDNLIEMSEKQTAALMLELTHLTKPASDYDAELQLLEEDFNVKKRRVEDEKQAFLNSIKTQKESIETKIKEQSGTIELLSRYKTSAGGDKVIKVYRSISNTNHSVNSGKQKRELRFVDAAVEVLRQEERFLTPETLYDKILFQRPAWKSKIAALTSAPSHKLKTCVNLLRASELVGVRKRGTQVLASYQGKIGLLEWTLDNGQPEAKYMKGFLFQGAGSGHII